MILSNVKCVNKYLQTLAPTITRKNTFIPTKMGKSKKSRHRSHSSDYEQSAKRSRLSPERKKEHKTSRSRRESRSPDRHRHQSRTKSPTRRPDVRSRSQESSTNRRSTSRERSSSRRGEMKIKSTESERKISSPPDRRERSKSPCIRSTKPDDKSKHSAARSYSSSPDRERKSRHHKSSDRSRPKKIYNFEVHKSKLIKIFFRETDLIPHSSNEYKGESSIFALLLLTSASKMLSSLLNHVQLFDVT